eukprot:Tbor_TRINITY_DN571_c0_g1::TRINITY_DN571_c0_g1_i1::g.23344::m.23344
MKSPTVAIGTKSSKGHIGLHDSITLDQTIIFSSIFVWMPYIIPQLYMALSSWDLQAFAILFVISILGVLLTVYVATKHQGDWLMIIAFIYGVLGELIAVTLKPEQILSRNAGMVVSAIQGVFGGILVRAKDIKEGCYYDTQTHTFADRLHFVIPFTIGQWMGFIVMNGWGGILKAFSSIFFCLATVGYGVVGYRIMLYFGIFKGDIIALVAKLFTTSFGVVFFSLVFSVTFCFYLAVPFISNLLALNAVMSSVGIIVEIMMYEMTSR